MKLRQIILGGLTAGVIGAVGVALWFLMVDAVAGRAFFTPAMLGSAVFWALRDPGAVQITFPAVMGYTMLHVVAFGIVGLIAAALAAVAEKFPSTIFLFVVLFVIFEFGFYVVVATLAQPLLGALAWTNVAIGNLIAALGMGFYLWRAHPCLRERLAEHPLGETVDGE